MLNLFIKYFILRLYLKPKAFGKHMIDYFRVQSTEHELEYHKYVVIKVNVNGTYLF